MKVKIQQIISIVEQLAPKYLAETWDNVGLQVGDPAGEASKVLVSLDVTNEVIEEAIQNDVDLVVCHHPLIFTPIKNLRFDTPLGLSLAKLIGNNIAVYAAHTNLDSAPKGVNALLAETIGLVFSEVLSPGLVEKLCKIVVFVPTGHEDAVRDAMAKAGAGWIGNYSHCTFQTAGTGTFKPLAGANPFLGEIGKLEKAEEFRIETIVPERAAAKVIKAMLKAHPYEEVAYDLYSLKNEGQAAGLGRVGRLPEAITLAELVERVKSGLGLSYVRVGGNPESRVEKVALCGGSGASLLHKAAFKGANVLLTGDIKYHEALDILAQGMSFIDAGHNGTERLIVPVLARYLREKAEETKLAVEIIESRVNTDPFQTV